MLWRSQVRKALVTLPWYVGIGLSIALLLQIIVYLFGGPGMEFRDFKFIVSVFIVFWLIRQFFRFWGTVAISSRESRQ